MEKEQRIFIISWWEKLQPLVSKFVRQTQLVGYDEDDLVQECFLLLQKAVENYDETLGVSFAYYYKTLLRGWRANKNKRAQKREVLYSEEAFSYLEDDRVNVEQDVERSMCIEEIYHEVQQLEAIQRRIIVAYYYEHKKIKDIARELGVSYKAIEGRKNKAIKSLRQVYEKHMK